jgi:hypothetical protein
MKSDSSCAKKEKERERERGQNSTRSNFLDGIPGLLGRGDFATRRKRKTWLEEERTLLAG